MWNLRIPFVFLFGSAAIAIAQAPPAIKPGTSYECPLVRARIKIFSCAGPADGDLCNVQTYFQGNSQSSLGKSTRQQTNSMMRFCHVQTPEEAKSLPAMPPPAAQKGK
jgi:hypothetical protein